ncbi:MAG TPA: hypothetical protein DIW17_07750 [Clostridiales bacterium]|nr:hypothetical protein [Clostridiales bacterium]
MADALEAENIYPQTLLKAVRENSKHLFVQSKPTEVSGKERFAWLEMDPYTYEVISVFDNGCHGAEYFINSSFLKEGTIEFLKGTWVGLNVSVWTVSFMNLQTDDTNKIAAQGKVFALSIGKKIAEFLGDINAINSLSGKLKEAEETVMSFDQEVTDLKAGTDSGEGMDRKKASKMALGKILENLPKFKLFGVDLKDTVASGFSGFSNGYNAAVDGYFHLFSGSNKNFQIEKEEKK